jgi:hypothetical protein
MVTEDIHIVSTYSRGTLQWTIFRVRTLKVYNAVVFNILNINGILLR